jgi:hypothetical protein
LLGKPIVGDRRRQEAMPRMLVEERAPNAAMIAFS